MAGVLPEENIIKKMEIKKKKKYNESKVNASIWFSSFIIFYYTLDFENPQRDIPFLYHVCYLFHIGYNFQVSTSESGWQPLIISKIYSFFCSVFFLIFSF